MPKRDKSLRIAVLTPIAAGTVVLLGITLVSNHFLESEHMNEEVARTIRNVEEMFFHEMEERVSLFSDQILLLQENAEVMSAWGLRDRRALQRVVTPLFSNLRSRYGATHLYFVDPDRRCFLRVHKPDIHGDTIDRPTMIEAEQEGRMAHGMELGPLGTFVLRVVVPWRIGGKSTGYIELSEDLEGVTQVIREILPAQFLLLIRKTDIDEASWVQGMELLGRKGSWDALPNDAVLMNTLGSLPKGFDAELDRYRKQGAQDALTVEVGGRTYRGGRVLLEDASNRDIGELFVFLDVTDRIASLARMDLVLAMVGLVVGGGLFAFFHFFVGRIQARVTSAHSALVVEIGERKAAEKEIRRSKEFIDHALESLPYPFMLISSADFSVLKANAAAKEYSSGDERFCYGLSHNSDHPCEEPHHVCPLKAVMRTRGPAIVEHTHFRRDGTARIMEVHAYPVFDEAGHVAQVIEYALDVTERKQMQLTIEDSLREKELLLRELHHRVRNNMQAIYGLLDLQSLTLKDPHAAELFKECQNRIISMAMVHEKLYQCPDLGHIDMHAYLQDLAGKVLNTFRGETGDIVLEVDIRDISFPVDTAIPCGIVVNELVSNALKHAFPGGRKGTVGIGLFPAENGGFELVVRDDGIGMPENLDPHELDSFGMQMLMAFGEDELGGTLTIRRDRGTTVSVRFHIDRGISRQASYEEPPRSSGSCST